MDQLLIDGGYPLRGHVRIAGAKNAVLPLMTASLLAPGRHVLRNVPDVVDVRTMSRLLDRLGVKIEWREGERTLYLDSSSLEEWEAPYDWVKTMRASVLVLGPLLAREGRARVSLPGGCAIGARPIDQHLRGLAALGAELNLKHGYVEAEARRLKGGRYRFDRKTVTGTENVLMAAVLAEGETILENAACEPEVVELARVLKQMGAGIQGEGTEVIEIEGVDHLEPFDCEVIPDRIEAGTFLAAVRMTGGEIELEGCRPDQMGAVIEKLEATGLEIERGDGVLKAKAAGPIESVDLKTAPYPGFPTDMQAQMIALLSCGEGIGVVTETIFENRFAHVSELRRMGADIEVEGRTAIVKGVGSLSGAPVMATDLRASASLVIAGLAAKGRTTLSRVYHLDRGYERIEVKLRALGASIERVSL